MAQGRMHRRPDYEWLGTIGKRCFLSMKKSCKSSHIALHLSDRYTSGLRESFCSSAIQLLEIVMLSPLNGKDRDSRCCEQHLPEALQVWGLRYVARCHARIGVVIPLIQAKVVQQ